MEIRLSAVAAAIFGAMLIAAPAQADPQASPPNADACYAVAAAKFHQWRQPKMLMQEAKTYRDGKTNNIQMIVTPNTAYAKGSFGPWGTVQIVIPERGARSPQQMALNMGLKNCAVTDHGQEAGEAATEYTYNYKPDIGGLRSTGTIWISDATGLPLRQLLKERGELANRRVATDISATYAYNDSVQIPLDAELANDTRIWNGQAGIRNLRNTGVSTAH